MSKAILVMTAIATLGAIAMASVAGATGPATYNVPKQTSKFSMGLVTAFKQCTAPSLSHRPALALPACPPIESTTMGLNGNTDVYEFGTKNGRPDGSANLTVQAKGGYASISTKFKSIEMNGSPLTTSPGPSPPDNRPVVHFIVRVTDTGCLDGMSNPTVACTVVDFPAFANLNCTAGSCKSQYMPLGALYPNSFHQGDTPMFEVGQVELSERGVNPDTIFRSGVLVK